MLLDALRRPTRTQGSELRGVLVESRLQPRLQFLGRVWDVAAWWSQSTRPTRGEACHRHICPYLLRSSCSTTIPDCVLPYNSRAWESCVDTYILLRHYIYINYYNHTIRVITSIMEYECVFWLYSCCRLHVNCMGKNAIWYCGKQVLVNEYDKKFKAAAILELSSENRETKRWMLLDALRRPTRTQRLELRGVLVESRLQPRLEFLGRVWDVAAWWSQLTLTIWQINM